MSNNGVKARQAWGQIKTAATHDGSDLLEGLAKVALSAWHETSASNKLSADRATREAFVASLVGAAVVDTALDKLAADGEYSVPEVEFLRDLNAEAALRDFARFQKQAQAAALLRPLQQKRAGLGTSIKRVLHKHPALIGAGIGGVAGAGFGAYGDDEDRLRGALRFALPGAIMGGLLGHGAGQVREELRSLRNARKLEAVQAARDAELHQAKLEALQAQAAAARRGRRA